MTQEDKELLLKDLCARLPYGVKCRYQHIQYVENGKIIDINMFGIVNVDGHIKDICDIKPYLFPMSSMTEEEFTKLKEYSGLKYDQLDLTVFQNGAYKMLNFSLSEVPSGAVSRVFDWLNKYHFDYRDLIQLDLAIAVTKENNPYKE